MKWHHYLLLLIPVTVYLFLRLAFTNSIEFGYDQPRLASRILEYLNAGNFLDTQRYAERSPWGNISWGPSLIFFFSIFFLVSKNPITVSLLISIFNLLSVILVVLIGKRYFSFSAGLIAGIFLATMPWWWVFSRMIYQPAPVPTFMAILILLTFCVIGKPKSFWIAPLIFTWGILLQLYFHSLSVVLVSIIFIASKFKKLSYEYLLLGIIITSFLFLPYLKIQSISDYFPDKVQNIMIAGRDDPISRIKNLVPHFITIIAGGDFAWQLGSGYDDFKTSNPHVENIFLTITIITVLIIVYNFFAAIKFSKNRIYRIALLLWTIAPLPFLTFMPLPSVPPIPRYFLLSLPSLSLLWGITFYEITGKFISGSRSLKYGFIMLFLLIPLYWFCFNTKYDRFIKNYPYPNGALSTYSDIPYLFLINSINFVFDDASNNKSPHFVISNDPNNPRQFALDWATGYILANVYGKDKILKEGLEQTYYLITPSPGEPKPDFKFIYKSGPYWVFRLTPS